MNKVRLFLGALSCLLAAMVLGIYIALFPEEFLVTITRRTPVFLMNLGLALLYLPVLLTGIGVALILKRRWPVLVAVLIVPAGSFMASLGYHLAVYPF